MSDSSFVIDIFLQPGEFYFGDADTRIRTLLGSCVSITMWHPTRRIGGMCHYMLPTRGRIASELDGKYADEAVAMFMNEIKLNKTVASEYQVKLFGGGNMFPDHLKKAGSVDIGRKNIEKARELAQLHGFKIAGEDMGKAGHRSVIFDVNTGHAWVKHVSLKK